jgi:hypothetical protein
MRRKRDRIAARSPRSTAAGHRELPATAGNSCCFSRKAHVLGERHFGQESARFGCVVSGLVTRDRKRCVFRFAAVHFADCFDRVQRAPRSGRPSSPQGCVIAQRCAGAPGLVVGSVVGRPVGVAAARVGAVGGVSGGARLGAGGRGSRACGSLGSFASAAFDGPWSGACAGRPGSRPGANGVGGWASPSVDGTAAGSDGGAA